jgi:hypothetical protein
MRGQVSVDFIIASLVVMSLFTLVFGIYSEKAKGVGTVMSSLEAQRIGERVAWNVNSIARGGEGAGTEVIIPDSIFGEDYYLFVEGGWAEVVWQHGGVENRHSTPLMTRNTKGGVFHPGTVLKVENRGGVVEIS